MTERDQHRLLEHMLQAQQDPCLLCDNRPIATVGLWLPNRSVEQHILHLPENKMAVFVHGLCGPCSRLPNAPQLVEQKLIQLQAVQN